MIYPGAGRWLQGVEKLITCQSNKEGPACASAGKGAWNLFLTESDDAYGDNLEGCGGCWSLLGTKKGRSMPLTDGT